MTDHPIPAPVAVLLEAARIIERGWTQRATARDFAGREVEASSPAATCWCACGAIDRAIESLGLRDVPDLYEAATDLAGGDQRIIRVNDTEGRTAGDIAAWLRHVADPLPASPPDVSGREE